MSGIITKLRSLLSDAQLAELVQEIEGASTPTKTAKPSTSKSQRYKAYKAGKAAAGKPVLSFNEWVVLDDRLAPARWKRSENAAKRRTTQSQVAHVETPAEPVQERPTFVRAEHVVNCMGSIGNDTVIGFDVNDVHTVGRFLPKGALKAGQSYTSRRGERIRVRVASASVAKLGIALSEAGLEFRS